MINLIKADLYRVFKSSTIYVALLVSIFMNTLCIMEDMSGSVLMPGSSIITLNGSGVFEYRRELGGREGRWGEDESNDIEMFIGQLSDERQGIARGSFAYNLNIYAIILIVFAYLVSDLSNNTVKNTLSSAISRKKYLLAKFISINFTTLILVFFVNISAYFIGRWLHPYRYVEPFGNIIKATAYQLPMILGMASMLIALALVTRKAPVYIAASIAIIFILPHLIYMAFDIYEWEHLRVFIWKYMQSSALMWLTHFPPVDYVQTCAVIGACEIAASGALGYLVFKKTDV